MNRGRFLVKGGQGSPSQGSFVWGVWHPHTHDLLLIISALRSKCALGLCFFVSFLHLILGVKLYLWEVWGGSYRGDGFLQLVPWQCFDTHPPPRCCQCLEVLWLCIQWSGASMSCLMFQGRVTDVSIVNGA